MRLLKRILLIVILLSALLLLIAPPLIGIGLQKYAGFISLFNTKDSKTEIIHYRRGWFNSDVTFRITFTEAATRKMLKSLGIEGNIPSNNAIVIKGRIQHGPVFCHPLKHFSRFGLAEMDRKLVLTPENIAYLNQIRIKETMLKANQAYLSFCGKYLDYYELGDVHLNFQNELNMDLDRIKMEFWRSPFSERVKANILLNQLTLGNQQATLLLPKMKIKFDITKDPHGLWLGTQDITFPYMVIKDATQSVTVKGFTLTGDLTEEKGEMSGYRNFVIKQFKVNDDTLGPIQLKMSIQGLKAQGVAEAIKVYEDIAQHGELYEFQLRQKLLFLLPKIISANSVVQVDHLRIETPDGALQMHIKLFWPEKTAIPENIRDVLRFINVTGLLRLPESLANQLISYLATLTYGNQISHDNRNQLIELDASIRLTTQQNVYAVGDVESMGLPREDAIALLTMIRDAVPLDEYLQEVRSLLFAKKINLEASYILQYYYLLLDNQINALEDNIASYQNNVAQNLQNQLQNYVKAGFILREGNGEGNEYVISISRQNDQLKINGRPVR